MVRDHLEDRTNRRTVLVTLGATGTGLTGLTRLGSARGSDWGMVQYVKYLKGTPPNRTKVYEEVPYEHWAVRFTAKDVKDRVLEMIRSRWGKDAPLDAHFGPMAGSPTGFGVRVSYQEIHHREEALHPEPSIEEVRRELPTEATGTDEHDGHAFRREHVPIRVVRERKVPQSCSGEDGVCQDTSADHYGGFLPGGVPIANPADSSLCTLTAAFHETGDGYGEGWISSGHAMNAGDHITYPDSNGDSFGICRKNNDDILNEIEWAYIEKESDETPHSWIANGEADGGNEYDVVGIVTDTGLINDVGTSTRYLSNGLATCRRRALINGVGGTGDTYVKYYHDTQAGDSGAPLFKIDSNGDALMAAKHTAAIQIGSDEDDDSCYDDGQGTTAETVENKVPGYFIT